MFTGAPESLYSKFSPGPSVFSGIHSKIFYRDGTGFMFSRNKYYATLLKAIISDVLFL